MKKKWLTTSMVTIATSNLRFLAKLLLLLKVQLTLVKRTIRYFQLEVEGK